MIPDHLIDKAAQAVLGSPGSTGRLEDLHPEDAAYMRADARAALEAVAADIWDEGYEYGRGDGECLSYTRPEDRPYREER